MDNIADFFRGCRNFGSGFGCLYWVSFASYHRIEDNLELEVEKPAEGNVVETLKTGTEYSALTYNIGFGAYTPDFSFFMDGGKSSWAKSKESVLETVSGAGKLAASYAHGFCSDPGGGPQFDPELSCK